MKNLKESLWGIALCLLIAVPSYILGTFFPIIGGPVFGIIIGMIITVFYKNKAKTGKRE